MASSYQGLSVHYMNQLAHQMQQAYSQPPLSKQWAVGDKVELLQNISGPGGALIPKGARGHITKVGRDYLYVDYALGGYKNVQHQPDWLKKTASATTTPEGYQFKVGDRVVINPGGAFPSQAPGKEGTINTVSGPPPLDIGVNWVDWPTAGVISSSYFYAAKDIILAKPLAPKPQVDFDTVVIEDEKRQQILEALEQIHQSDLIFTEWGFHETMEKGKGVSMLFYGPPGTGKTLMAQAIANKLEYELKIISAADIESAVPGEAERNIRTYFQKAKGKSILLFDECDSLIYTRQHVGPIMGAQINELLSQIERFGGVTLFTTNRLGTLDEALNRRLALKLEFSMPTIEQRVEIWKRMFPEKAPLSKKIDWKRLAGGEITGGYIKNTVLRAVRMAATEKIDNDKKKIRMKHLVKALQLEVESMIEFDEARAAHRGSFGHVGQQLGFTKTKSRSPNYV